MQVSTQLVSAGLMGVLLVGVVAAVLVFRDWRHDEVLTDDRPGSLGSSLYRSVGRGMRSQVVWVLGFLGLTFVVGGAIVLFLEGGPMSATAGMTVVGVAAVVLVAFVGLGTYRTVRFRGRTSAGAAAVAAWTLGSLLLVAITLNLLLA
ncbi:hypothetical protein [Halomarina oriensis]|uniref:Uncharacterized protein n=1 Tax=Halomarina oriensis TaxID=671145 RepID=A0A6B0GTI1_9EURY|nr:hypothetical protein [Halomarina oriensis]MWG35923.1 hypothetical protein [Halomarina oriensis]